MTKPNSKPIDTGEDDLGDLPDPIEDAEIELDVAAGDFIEWSRAHSVAQLNAGLTERRLLREKKSAEEVAKALEPYNTQMKNARLSLRDIEQMRPGARARAEEITMEERQRRDAIRRSRTK